MLARLLSLLCLCSISVTLSAEEPDYLKAFPPAKQGMTRFVIQLPHQKRGEDQNFQVELIVGQELETDGVNRVSLGGKLEEQPLEGWGFTYYQVKTLGPLRSTLIGVPEGTPKVQAFVRGPSKLISYNSRVPIVVYVPEGAEVRYRL